MIPIVELLALEASQPHHTPRKATTIRDRFGCSPARYYLDVVRMINTPDLRRQALEHDPSTTNRLIRIRDERHAHRTRRNPS